VTPFITAMRRRVTGAFPAEYTKQKGDDMLTRPIRTIWWGSGHVRSAIWCMIALTLGAGMIAAAPLLASPADPTPAAHAVTTTTPGANLRAPEIQAILDRGELIVAMTAGDQPPFYYVQADGQLAGLDADLARDIASRLGVKVRFHRGPTSFNAVVELVARGGADVGISKLSRTLARAQMVRFTKPYVTFRHAILLHRLKLAQYTSEERHCRSSSATSRVRLG
jgi:polar amino acid transport system substrate-binding protein